jgi:hypothetical protein
MTGPVKDAPSLTPSDLAAHPVWRFLTPDEAAAAGADESCVCAEAAPPAVGAHGSYLVAATYRLRDGTTTAGLVQVDVLGARVEFDPCVIFAAGKSVEPLGHDAARRLARLLKITDAQPVGWTLAVTLGGERALRSQAIGRPGAAQVLGLLFKLARLKRMR